MGVRSLRSSQHKTIMFSDISLSFCYYFRNVMHASMLKTHSVTVVYLLYHINELHADILNKETKALESS